jgi:membrane-bound lytic murein transglycosylase D
VDLIQRYQSPTFGFASKNFYAEFLAVVDIATNSDLYFPFLRTHRPVALREIEVTKRAPLFAVLKPAAISQNDFFEWNPALDPTAKFIPLGYRVKLPPDRVDDFLSAHRRALATPSAKKIAITSKPRNSRSTLEIKKAGKVVTKPAIRPAVKTKVTRKPNLTSAKPNPAIRS